MHLGHGSVGDESDEGVRGDHAEGDDEHVAEGLEVVCVEAGVDDKQEDGRHLRRPGERVLDRRVLWQQFGREVVGGQVLVVRRERVALQTERADPQLRSDVELAAESNVHQERETVMENRQHTSDGVRARVGTRAEADVEGGGHGGSPSSLAAED